MNEKRWNLKNKKALVTGGTRGKRTTLSALLIDPHE